MWQRGAPAPPQGRGMGSESLSLPWARMLVGVDRCSPGGGRWCCLQMPQHESEPLGDGGGGGGTAQTLRPTGALRQGDLVAHRKCGFRLVLVMGRRQSRGDPPRQYGAYGGAP